jgi:hypothetical protein
MASYNVLLRNAQLDAITTFIGNAAKLRIYTGSTGTTTTLLAEFTLGSPFAGAAGSASLSVTLPSNVNASNTGTAGWARIVKSDGTTQCIDLTVGTSGADLNLNTLSLVSGNPVSVTSFSIARGNA